MAEDAVKCCDGDPAASGEKLRVMQRRLYMDEECLLDYRGGGIEFKDIHAFDKWIAQPENRDRILPFPRTIAGFRVRRFEKEREDGEGAWRAFVNVQLAQADKFTYFYVRNGEQVWRIVADFEFEEMLFPDQSQFDPAKPMMVKFFGDRVDEMITRDAWEVMKAEEEEQYRLYTEWKQENPEESWIQNPHRNSIGFSFSYKEYKPFDPSNVYYDDITDELSKQIKRYNRIAVIIQGLFDRSLVIHPHPPVHLWTPEGFESAVELIYDAMTLTHGDAPDFEAYRTRLNALLDADSVVTGQEDYWLRLEAERENQRIRNDWRNRERRSNYKRFRPYGDKGPGVVGPMASWKPRVRKAVFRWEVETSWRTSYYGSGKASKPRVLEVPANNLLNVSAYRPGDFKQFFADPRTRKEYLKWAPLLLAAEDYYANKAPPAGPDFAW